MKTDSERLDELERKMAWILSEMDDIENIREALAIVVHRLLDHEELDNDD